MTKVLTDQQNYTDIANAIRGKNGTTTTYKPNEMASAITNLPSDESGDELKGLIERTITSCTVPEGTTEIGDYVFFKCTNLTSASLPSGITNIGTYAFYRCTNLTLTSLPSGITNIGSTAFYNCANLTFTSLPSALTTIGSNALAYCTSLTTLTFEGTPTTINATAFTGCTHLTTINVPWAENAVANAPWGATNATINYNYTGE